MHSLFLSASEAWYFRCRWQRADSEFFSSLGYERKKGTSLGGGCCWGSPSSGLCCLSPLFRKPRSNAHSYWPVTILHPWDSCSFLNLISMLYKMVYTGQQLSIAKMWGFNFGEQDLWALLQKLTSIRVVDTQTTFVPTADLGISAHSLHHPHGQVRWCCITSLFL